ERSGITRASLSPDETTNAGSHLPAFVVSGQPVEPAAADGASRPSSSSSPRTAASAGSREATSPILKRINNSRDVPVTFAVPALMRGGWGRDDGNYSASSLVSLPGLFPPGTPRLNSHSNLLRPSPPELGTPSPPGKRRCLSSPTNAFPLSRH